MLGVVTSVVGNAVVKGVDGQTRQVAVGDEIREGDVIITASSAFVEIDCSSESPFVIAEDTEFLASAECFSFDGDASDNEVADETIAAVAAALESGGDLLEVLEATAAGGTSGNNGHTFIRLGRIVLALSEGSTVTEEELLAVLEDVLGQADLIEQLPALVSILGEYDIAEGDTSGAFVVVLNQSPERVGSDIVVTLNYSGVAQDGTDFNGVASVVIPAGSNAAAFNIDTVDDALAEGAESFTISIGTITDTNFVTIDADPNASSVTSTIVDESTAGPEDTALVSISGEYTIVEGETSGEFTVAVNQAASDVTSDITIALTYSGVAEDGTDFTGVTEVTIAAGTNSTTFSIDTIDDALAEGSESLVISLSDITDTNFEAIAADPAASSVANAIIDETDPDAPNPPDTAYELRLFAVVQVEGTDESPEFEYVAANEIAEDGGVGTYVVLAVDENGDPLADADQPGGTVTVNVGAGTDTADRGDDYASAATVAATVGTTFTIAAIDDVLADNGEVFTLGLGEDWSRAGEFEGVSYSGSVTTTIVDETDNDPGVPEDNDIVTVSLGDLAVDEGSGDVTITGSLNAVPDEEFVVTLDNGATITFGTDYVAGTEIESTPFGIQGDDVFVDAETFVLGVTSVTSGVFEAVNVEDSSQVVVSDTIDTVTVDLSATETVAEDGTITYTATLTGGVANNDITVTLANGEVITIAAGAASGTVDVAAPVDDAYVTASITNSIASAVESNAGTAGALENLVVAGDTSVSTDVTENDTETAISLVDLAVDEGSGTASVTATIANAPTDGPVVVTLDNGATITFAVGATSATSTAFAIQGDDVYLDGETLTLNASVTSGGSEFENLTLDPTVAVVVSDTIDTVTVDLSATETVAEDGTITYTATLTGGVANNDITVTLANGEVITIAAGAASGTVDVAAPVDDAYVTASITNSIASAVESNAGTAGALENLVVAGDTSVSTDVTENDTETAISLVDLAVDEGSGTASVTATIANAPTDGPVVVTLDNGATITFAVGATSATSTAFAIQGDDVYLDGETLTLNASVTSGGSEFENLTLDPTVAVVVSDTIDTVTVDLSATETVAEDGTITYTATLTGGVANNDITVTLANGEVITIAAGAASGTVDVAAPVDDAYVTASITNSIASAVESNAGTAGALENLVVAGDTSVSTDVTENDTETAISLVDLAVDEGSGTASVTATIANAPTDGPVVVTLDNGATITFAVGATSATSTAFAIQGDDVYLDGETLTLNASVTSGGSEFENLTLDPTVAVVVSDTIDTVTVDLSATETVAEDGTITYTATLTGGVANNDITVTLANGEVITIAAGAASGTVDVAAPVDDAYVTASITNSIASAVESNAGTAGALENLVVAGDTSVSTDVTENDTETAISLVDLAVDEGSGTASVTATIANAPTDGPVVVTLDNGATITFAVGATSATSTAFAIQGDDVYLDGETLTLNASVTSGGSEFENLTLDPTVAVVVSDTIDTVTVDLSATETVAEDGTITYTATLTGGVANNDITVTLANGEVITIAAGAASGTVDVAAPVDDAYVTASITNSIASAVESNAGTAGALENLVVAGDTSVSTDVTENDTETAISLVDLAVDEGSGTASVTATIANAPTDGPVVVTLDNGATITFAVGATSATSTAFAIQGDDVYLDGETLTLNASVTSGGSEFENLTLDPTVAVVVSDTIDTVTVDLSATETVAEDGTITYTATLTGGVANNDITVTLANGEVITIAAGAASGTVDVAAPVDDAYVTASITNSIASAVESNAGTAGALENLVVAGDTSVSTDVTENDTETAISLVDLAVDEGSGTASVTATIANAPTDGPVVVTLDNGATITFAVGATSATSTAFAIQGDDVYLDGETLTLNASVTSGGSEFENLTLDPTVAVVVSDTIDTVTVDLSATETVAEDGTITYTATLTGGVANNDITVTLANGEVITIAAGAASGTVDVAAPVDDAYVTASITNSIASAVESNAGTAGALENLVVAGDTSVSTDVTENDTETAISLVDLAVDEGSGTASVTATIANAPTDGPVVVTLDNGATITFAVGATSATSTAFAIQGDDVYLDGETLTLNASVTSGGSEFENLTLDPTVAVVVSDTIDTVTVDLSATETVAEDGTITYTATLTGGVANNDITVTLANGEVITIAAGAASGTVDVAAPVDDAYVTASITNSIASAVESNAGTAGALENLVVAGDTSVSTDVTENDTETAISLVDLAVDEGSGTASVTATIANAPTDGPVVVTLDNGATITFAVGATSATSTAFAIQGDDVYLDGETLTLNASVTSGGSEFENLTLDPTVAVVVSDTIDTVTVDLSATETVAEDGTITYTATLTGGVANNDITVTLANGEVITIAAGAASGTVDVAAPVDDAYVTASITNSIASAVESNAGTAGALENLVVAGDTSVSTDVTENDTETAISLVDLAVDEGSGTASVTATIANAPTDGPVVVTLDNGATITFAVGATSATSTAFAIQGDDVYLDGETLTLNASVTSGGSEFENLTLDPTVAVVVSDTIDTVTVDLSATETVAEDGTITYTATLTGGVANNDITVTLANGEVITIAAGAASGTVDVAAPVDDAYVTASITNSIASAVESNAGTAGALENLVVAGDTSVSTDVTENDTETAISLVDLAVDEGSGTASVTATIANAPTDGPVVVTLDNGATITFAVGATSATSTAFAIQGDDVYLDGETLTLNASVTSGGSEFENLTLDPTVAVVVSDTIDTVTVDLSATETVAEDGTITYTATLTGGVANNDITVTLANGEVITIAAGAASGTVDVAAPVDDAYVTASITNSIASAVESNAGTAGALENLVVAGDTSVSTDVTENDTETAISLVDLAVDEGSGTASVTATIANAPTDGPVVVTLDNGATITFAVGATSATSTAFAIQGDDVYLDGETLTLNASVTSGGSEFENLTLDPTVAVVVSDTIDTVTVDLSATETVAEDGTITYTATLTGGVANNDITVTLANGEVITIAAGAASGTVDVAAPVDDAYVTASITNSIASAVESNAGTAGALENLVVAGDTSVSTDVTENDTETAISLVDLAVDEGSGTASVTATIANAPTDGPVVVTLDNGATITFAVGATSATSTAFAIQGDDVYLDGETLTLNASVTSGGSEFENLTLDPTVAVVVSDTIDTVTVDLSATETVAEDGTITYTATLTGGVANNDITVTLANGEVITIAAGAASGTVDVAAPVDDAYVTASITNSIASAVESNAGTAGALENLVVAGDTSVSTDVTENDTETAISLVDLAVDEGSGTASVTATIANAPTDGPVVVTLDNGATITFAVGATSATSTAFAIQGDDVYLDGETLTLNASVTSGGSEFENLTLDPTVAVVVSDTIDTVTVDLSATETVAEDGTITYTATLTGGVANNDITVTLANGEVITIAAGAASGTVDVAAPVDDAYVTASITNSIASAVESNAGTAGALENLVVAGDTSVSTDVTENDTETAISLVDLAVDEGSGTASVTATIANAPTDGPVVVTLDNGATITFAVGATSATSTAFAIQGDDVYLDGETLTLNASVTSGGSEFENLTLDPTVAVVVSDTIDTVTVDLSATETVAEDGTITYTATLTGGVANNDITVTLANGEVITIAAGAASGTVDVAAPVDDAYVTASITNSIASAVESNAGTAGALENLVVAGDTSVSTDVTENDTETAISLVDLAVDEGSGTASVTATIANAPTDGPVVVTLDNGATITFAVGATSATSTAFAIQGDDVYLDGETLTLNASVTSGGSEFENLTLDPTVAVVVSDTIDTVTVDLSATETVAEDGTITYTATLTGGVANNDITVTLANGEVITIAAGAASGTVDVAAPVDDAYVTASITNSIASAVESNAGTAGALENLVVAGDTSVSTDVTENDTETAISLVDLAVDEGSGTASVTATIANAPTDGPVVVTLDNGATITFAVGATSATSTAFAIQGDDVYLDGETLTLNASVTSGGSEFENLTLDPTVAVVVSDTIDTVTVTLGASSVSEGEDITITASVVNAPQSTDLEVTLDNGEVITIAVGQTSGSVTFVNTGSSGDTFTYAISSATGGNYEDLDTTDTVDVNITAPPLSASASDVSADEEVLVDGVTGNESYTSQISVSGGAGDIVSAVIEGSTNTNGSWSVSATGLVTYTLTTAYSHADGNGENIAENVDSVTITVTDSSGSTAQVIVNADVIDDVPVSLSAGAPSNAVVDGSGVVTSGDITFDPGADGLGEIVFAGTNGAAATNTVGEQLYLEGEPLVLVGAGTGTLSLQTADGTVAMTVTIVNDGNGDITYEINPLQIITDTLQTSQIDFSGFSGGNSSIYAIVDGFTGNSSGLDVVFTSVVNDSNGNHTVNTNANLLGAGAGQDIDFDGTTGDVVTLSLQQGVSVTGNGGNAVVTQGTEAFASAIIIPVDAIDANATVIVTFTNTVDGSTYSQTYSIADMVADPTGTYDYIIDIAANEIGFLFNEVAISAGSTDGNSASFKLGQFSLAEEVAGEPVDLQFDIVGSDADGDSTSGTISFTLTPPGSAPVAIDLDGDGLEYLSLQADVVFNDQSTGESVNTAWVASDDGLLVIDANNSGTVDTTSEYVFTEWSETAQTDLEAIAEVFDTNQDGVLDAQDERFDEFAVWQDADSDGVTDEGELSSLTDLGIESIELTYREGSEDRIDGEGDVTVFGQANVNYVDGSTTTAEDVSFAVEAADLLSEEDDLTALLSDESASEGGEASGPSRADASAIDIAQLELTLNFDHNESDSFDQPE